MLEHRFAEIVSDVRAAIAELESRHELSDRGEAQLAALRAALIHLANVPDYEPGDTDR